MRETPQSPAPADALPQPQRMGRGLQMGCRQPLRATWRCSACFRGQRRCERTPPEPAPPSWPRAPSDRSCCSGPTWRRGVSTARATATGRVFTLSASDPVFSCHTPLSEGWRMLKLRGHGAAQVWATTLYHTGVNAGLIILRVASLGRDAQNERDGAADAQLRRISSSVAAAAPSQFGTSNVRLKVRM